MVKSDVMVILSVAIFLVMCITGACGEVLANATVYSHEAIDTVARFGHRHKTHNVTVYSHEAILAGTNDTAIIVAGPNGDLSQLQKGCLLVVDEIITETADINSKQLGKLEGLYILNGGVKYRAELSMIIDQPGDLIESIYEIIGQRQSFNATIDRTLAVVAGTGVFLGQRGYALSQTVYQQLLGTKGGQYNTQKWTLVVGPE